MWSTLRCCLNSIKIPSLTKTCIRHYMKTSDKMQLLLKQSDQIPSHCNLVYRQKSYRMVGFMYHGVNAMTCVTITVAAHYLYTNGFTFGPDNIENHKMFNSPFETAGLFITTVVMFVIAAVSRHRYPIRIYHDEKKKVYKAIFVGKFPFTVEHHEFPEACLTYASRESIFPWKNTLFNANGRKINLFEEKFRTQGDFYAMLRPEELKNLEI